MSRFDGRLCVSTSLDDNGFAFVARVPVRWSDMDAFGHINHARMVTLLEEARIEWLLSSGSEHIEGGEDLAIFQPLIKSSMIVHVEVRYQGQLRHEDTPLQVGMWIKQVRSVDFTIGYEVRSATADPASKAATVASTQLAVVDIEAERLQRLTAQQKDYLQGWMRD